MENDNINKVDYRIVKKYVLLIIHFFLPVILAFIIPLIFQYFPEELKREIAKENAYKESSFINLLYLGFIFSILIIFGANTSGKKVKSKTGKSFETKSGMVLDEYETRYIDTSIRSNRYHTMIFLCHIFLLIFLLYTDYKNGIFFDL
jgi:hypothetical protein